MSETKEVTTVEREMMSSASQASATIERANIILKLIAKHIRPTEIRLFGTNMHFERSACEKILMWAGAKIKNVRLVKDEIRDEKGETYYDYEAWGTVEIDGRDIELMGNCSTRSDFFGTKDGQFKPISEVDIPSVKQAAITNLWNHACVRSLGLKSLTLDDLKAAGMDTAKIEQVSFSRGSQGGSTITPEEKKQQTDLGNWLLEMNGGDKAAASKELVTMTEFKGKDGSMVAGIDTCSKLYGKRLQIAYAKVKTAYEAYCKKNGIPMPEQAKAAREPGSEG